MGIPDDKARYDSRSWWSTILQPNFVFFWNVFPPVMLAFIWSSFAHYIVQRYEDVRLPTHGFIMVGSFVSFLVVFRAHQAYHRYERAYAAAASLSHELRDVVRVAIGYLKIEDEEGKLDMDQAAVHITRYVLSIAISVCAFCRIAEYRYHKGGKMPDDIKRQLDMDITRLEHLLLDEEFVVVQHTFGILQAREDACCMQDPYWVQTRVPFAHRASFDVATLSKTTHAKILNGERTYNEDTPSNICSPPIVVCTWLTRECAQHCGHRNGYSERMLLVFDDHISRIITEFQNICGTIELPFPGTFAQMCKLMMLVFILLAPFCVEKEITNFVAVVTFPTLAAFAYFGIEYVAVDIEVPFGYGVNDISMLALVHDVEQHCMQTLHQLGDSSVINAFQWTPAPDDYRRVDWYLRLRSSMRRTLGQGRQSSMIGPIVSRPPPKESVWDRGRRTTRAQDAPVTNFEPPHSSYSVKWKNDLSS